MDPDARKRLVDDHLALVRSLASQVKCDLMPPVELDDLVSYGTEGLIEAANRFDASLGVGFRAYAFYRVRGAIYDGLRRMGHLPRTAYAKLRMAERSTEYVANFSERDAGLAGGKGTAGAVEDHLRTILNTLQGVAVTFLLSLEAMPNEGRDLEGQELMPDERLALGQVLQRVREAVTKLPERERHFIEAHYFQDKTLQDAGAELGLSKSWASRLHARAVDLLKGILVGEER
ncbi:MAG: sigma-70 family RNA polymerase sigma factor [Deltaproteobacteria bacterium]|nr:sigma-70 family RNA polymerase sigma factor [Deltaproteobacteria bacterium]